MIQIYNIKNYHADDLIKMRNDNVDFENNLAQVKIELQDKNNLNIELLKQIEALKNKLAAKPEKKPKEKPEKKPNKLNKNH